MACTVAVEEVIGEHYNDQIRELMKRGYDDEELRQVLRKHRDDELAHKDTALQFDAERVRAWALHWGNAAAADALFPRRASPALVQAPLYQALTGVVKAGCRAAIAVSSKV